MARSITGDGVNDAWTALRADGATLFRDFHLCEKGAVPRKTTGSLFTTDTDSYLHLVQMSEQSLNESIANATSSVRPEYAAASDSDLDSLITVHSQ